MYLTVNLKTNTILVKHWQRIGGRTVKVSCELKAYDENGRAAEVLRRSREKGLSLEEVISLTMNLPSSSGGLIQVPTGMVVIGLFRREM